MSEQKIANTFEKMRTTIDQYTTVVRQDGALWKSIEELGGDPAWLNDIKTALDAVYTAIDEADMGARMHLDMQDESADLSEEPNEGNEFSGALAQAKQSGKKEFEVDGKKYKVQEGATISPTYIEHLKFKYGDKQSLTPKEQREVVKDILNRWDFKNIETIMMADIPHVSQMARIYLKKKTPGGMNKYNENNMFMGAVGKPYEDEDNPVKDAIMHRLSVSYGMEDLLKKYGLDRVEAAIDDVASFHDDAEELGSSDISIMVKQVMDNLESTNESLGYLKKLAGI
jgi:hypothetical protein